MAEITVDQNHWHDSSKSRPGFAGGVGVQGNGVLAGLELVRGAAGGVAAAAPAAAAEPFASDEAGA